MRPLPCSILLAALSGCSTGTAPPPPGEPDPAADGAAFGPDGATPAECGRVSFGVTETQERFVVPSGVSYLHVKAWGAGGNGEGQCAFDDGGLGGYGEAAFAVSAGMELVVIVGKRGRAGMTGEERFRFGFGNWGGGGLSGLFRGPGQIDEHDADRALLVAGGGGSAGAPGCHPGLTGNHTSAGDMPTMLGGAGIDDINGGGGGYRGGRGGARGEAGNGGSGWVDPTALDSLLLASAPGGEAPPRTDDPDYDGSAGTTEMSGLVVLHFDCAPPTID